MKVTVMISVRGRDVPATEVADKKMRAALVQMGNTIGKTLEDVKCPTHDKPPTNVRLHVNASGNGDLRYDSCCEELGKAVARATSE